MDIRYTAPPRKKRVTRKGRIQGVLASAANQPNPRRRPSLPTLKFLTRPLPEGVEVKS